MKRSERETVKRSEIGGGKLTYEQPRLEIVRFGAEEILLASCIWDCPADEEICTTYVPCIGDCTNYGIQTPIDPL